MLEHSLESQAPSTVFVLVLAAPASLVVKSRFGKSTSIQDPPILNLTSQRHGKTGDLQAISAPPSHLCSSRNCDRRFDRCHSFVLCCPSSLNRPGFGRTRAQLQAHGDRRPSVASIAWSQICRFPMASPAGHPPPFLTRTA